MRISDWSSDVCSSDLFSQTAGNWFKAGPGPGLRKTRIFCCPPGHNGGSKMTDDLTRGYEGQDANVNESAETVASETGAQATQPGTPLAGPEGAAAMVGQAGETVVVPRPAPGQAGGVQAGTGKRRGGKKWVQE